MISVVLTYWTDKVPSYGWILIFWAIYQCVSFFGVIVYGEVEFWLAVWKVICVLVGYLLAILVNTGAIGGDYIGFRFWRDPGPFANGINGFGQSFVLAAVYFSGTEMIAITAGESRNPKRDVPKVCSLGQWERTSTRTNGARHRPFNKPSTVLCSSSWAWYSSPVSSYLRTTLAS